jgi:TrpR family trp operon transcriptional repressor
MSDFQDVIKLIGSVKDEQLLEDLLMGLTTEEERHKLVQRVEIIKRLIAGEPQHKIAQELGVGVATVTRGSKELAGGRFRLLKEEHEKH